MQTADVAQAQVRIGSPPPANGSGVSKGQGLLVPAIRRRLYPREQQPQRLFFDIVQSYAKDAKRILDVGCGRGAPDLMKADAPNALRYGVDLDPGVAPEGCTLFAASCTAIPLDSNVIDLAFSKSVLEHLEEPQASFREIARVLAPGGRFVVLTPNRFDYVSVAASVIPNSLHPWLVRVLTGRDESDTFPTFYRANTHRQIAQLCCGAGLELERFEYLREHPHYLQRLSVTYLAGVACEQCVQRPIKAVRPWLLAVLRKGGSV